MFEMEKERRKALGITKGTYAGFSTAEFIPCPF
jgi:hypothetical protein